MRIKTRYFVRCCVMILAALLTLPALYIARASMAAAPAQDTSRSDTKPLNKTPRTHAPNAVAAAPANDNCANAITINACPFTDAKDTTMATDEAGEPGSTCTTQSKNIWYNLPASATRRNVTVDTCGSAPVDTAIMVWQVNAATPCNFASFVAVACNDDFGGCGDGFQSSLGFVAQANQTYKIQIGGFAGDTGALTINVNCTAILCDDIVINGTLGTGDPNFTGTQTHGTTTGRLNRNGVSSSCAAPKTCLIFDTAPGRAFDTYAIPNQSGQAACVSVNLTEPANGVCNLQSNAYLGTFNPASICTNYLADPGLSTGVPPTPTNMSFTVPAGQTLVLVVMTTNPGETGCPYTLTVSGNLCSQFDFCVQDDNNPSRFILINSTNGDYEFHDCSKGVTVKGRGGVSISFCKIDLVDSGPNPKKPDRSIFVEVNSCTNRGTASLRLPGSVSTINLNDTDVTNNNCKCP